MKLSQLRNLVAVAKAGSIRQASRDLNLSQSAITKSIKMLEEELGAELLHRASHGVSPTASGDALIARAQVVDAELNHARNDIDYIEGGRIGDVKICASPTVAVSMVPRAVINFKKKWPNVNIQIEEAVFPDNLPAIRTGELDLAVCMLTEQTVEDGLNFEVLVHDEVTPAVRIGHPLAQKRELGLADLIDEDWILFGRSTSSRAVHEQTFRVNGLEPPKSSVMCASFAGALSLLEYSNFVMLVPKQIFAGRPKAWPVTPLRLTTPMQPWTIVVVTRSSTALSSVCREFIEELRNIALTHSPSI